VRAGHGPFSLVRHVGRKPGRTYETPVILVKVPEGFIAELTYGAEVDWFRNVVAAGGCVVIHRGKEYCVNQVEPCSAPRGRRAYAAPFRLVLKAAGRNEFRLLRTDDSRPQLSPDGTRHADEPGRDSTGGTATPAGRLSRARLLR
jgi:deazaflavin-dependent oxidoreductase (nitroreductase family)